MDKTKEILRKKSEKRKEKLKELFEKLDRNKDGVIEFSELQEGLSEMWSKRDEVVDNKDAQLLYDKMKHDSDMIDFREFVRYINEKNKNTKIIFSDIDLDKNGVIDEHEIKKAFEKVNVHLNDNDVKYLIQHIDGNKSLNIDWKEWKNFFQFAPYDHLEDVLRHWRRRTFVEFGEHMLPHDFTIKEKENGFCWRSLYSDAITGMITRSFTAPLERVKIYMQVKNGSNLGIFGAMKNMIKEGGVKSLWRGNGMNIFKVAPENGLKFLVYEQIKANLGKDGEQLSVWEKILYGSMAGFTSQSIIYPIDVLKTRMALRYTGQYANGFDCVKKIYKLEGIRAFYRGYLINTIGVPTIGAVDFAVYETLKEKYKNIYPNDVRPTIPVLLLIANTSSSIAMLSCYPLFMIRTRLQTNISGSIVDMTMKIFKNDGILGFYRGCIPNLIKVIPAASIGSIIDSKVSQLLGIKN